MNDHRRPWTLSDDTSRYLALMATAEPSTRNRKDHPMTRILRWFLALAAIAVTAFQLLPAPAFADDGAPGRDLGQIRVPAALITLLVSLAIPLATGWASKATWSSRTKDAITILLNAVNVLIVGAVVGDGSAVFSFDTLFTWLIATVTSIATYFRVYKKAGLTSSVIEVNGIEVAGKLASIGVK